MFHGNTFLVMARPRILHTGNDAAYLRLADTVSVVVWCVPATGRLYDRATILFFGGFDVRHLCMTRHS